MPDKQLDGTWARNLALATLSYQTCGKETGQVV
jgi:hypothetical protein